MQSFIINRIAVYEEFYVMYVLLEARQPSEKKNPSVPAHINVIAAS